MRLTESCGLTCGSTGLRVGRGDAEVLLDQDQKTRLVCYLKCSFCFHVYILFCFLKTVVKKSTYFVSDIRHEHCRERKPLFLDVEYSFSLIHCEDAAIVT